MEEGGGEAPGAGPFFDHLLQPRDCCKWETLKEFAEEGEEGSLPPLFPGFNELCVL